MVKFYLPMQEMQEMRVHSLGQKDPLEKEMATHSSIFAWEIPCTEELGGLQSKRLQKLNMTKHTHTYRKIETEKPRYVN